MRAQKLKTIKQCEAIVGSLSKPSKMPGYGTSLPAKHCNTGSKLRGNANSVCASCYACKGRYVFPNVQKAMERRFASLGHPQWVEAMAIVIQKKGCKEFRWHDSGDLQGNWHLVNILEVARLTPEVKHWVPTKEYALLRKLSKLETFEVPSNVCIRVSSPVKGRQPLPGFAHTSTVDSGTGFPCPATRGEARCDAHGCRACWDPAVKNVDYKSH